MITSRTAFLGVLVVMASSVITGEACATPDGLPIGKHNSKTPIEITSDTLDVLQETNQAVFSGHVVAIQGDVRLTADKMTVTYAKSAGSKSTGDKKQDKKVATDTKAASDTKKAAETSPPKGAIKKIDVVGKIFLATQQETARGETGVYDVEHQEIKLNDNVMLTRGQNVLKGDHLVYSFATGKSQISGGKAAASGTSKGRVKALFVPSADKK